MVENNEYQLLSLAIKLATDAHTEAFDKGGSPYIGHPLRVMNGMNTTDEKIVAVLHDAIEDSPLTLEDLTTLGFSSIVIEAIEAITKRDGEEYEVYLNRVMVNPIALKVKIADMTDNMDISRIANPTPKDYQRLKKYKSILLRLQAIQERET